jgi:hypothetical protein
MQSGPHHFGPGQEIDVHAEVVTVVEAKAGEIEVET